MKCAVFTKDYRGIPVTAFWMRPATPGNLIYGYQLKYGDFEVWGTGFTSSTLACRAAANVIDGLHTPLPKKRKGSRASGTNPRAMHTNPRAMHDTTP
jgi:hypothetical protein